MNVETQGPATTAGRKADMAAAIENLRRRFGDRVATGEAVRRQHANTLTWIPCEPPDAVVWPLTTAEVVEIVGIARAHRAPLIAFGGGTSLEGHVNAPFGGISVDLTRMDRVIAVNARDLDCTVEAGVTLDRLAEELRTTGLFFPVDPGAGSATLGGMAATRASGTTTVRYGSMRDNVVSLTAVLASGEIVRTGGRARKSAAGYDLTRLLVGSEGTLGITTELTLRLHPVPERIVAAVSSFPSVAAACDAAIAAVQMGLGVARIELMDAGLIRAVNAHAGLGLAEAPTLFVEFHGSPAACREGVEAFTALAADEGAGGLATAASEEERRRLWAARHDAFWAIRGRWPGKAVLVTDVCVPVSRLAECVEETLADIRSCNLTAPIVGHVGDGNFHALPILDADDARQLAEVRGFVDRLARRAIAMDGTCTGEHGIGQGKADWLAHELGAGVDVMRAIKQALDPDGILNPGKIFPASH